MRKMLYTLAVAMLILIAMAIVPATAESSSNEKISVIIGFKDKSDAKLVKAHGGEIKYQYNTISAIAVSLPEKAINALENNPNVGYIEEDVEVHISKKPILPVTSDDIYPWGVDRVEADLVHNYTAYRGFGVNVSIIDTGIYYPHPDLNDNYCGGYDFVNGDDDPLDDNGHGTHVAGTIAAVDNDLGVIGVAPEANLYAVKALNKRGAGYTSDVIAAIEWAVANHMDVISMSLGSDKDEQSLHNACDAANASGVTIVAAAGNDASDVDYPAAYDSVIAVSAIDDENNIAYFSSRGPEVELTAPGVSVYSTYIRDRYATMSGTSMATPHVSGVVALVLSADPTLTNYEVRGILQETATDLGYSELFGYGLVNANEAIKEV
jgi:subtilisin family serine protease